MKCLKWRFSPTLTRPSHVYPVRFTVFPKATNQGNLNLNLTLNQGAFFELLKNSMRVTIERTRGLGPVGKPPPIVVTVADAVTRATNSNHGGVGKCDSQDSVRSEVIVKISDQGGDYSTLILSLTKS